MRNLVIENMDSEGIIELISKMQFNPEKTAILCRIHGPLKKLSRLMAEEEIPHTYFGKKSELRNSEEFARLHAFPKLIVNPFCNMSFLLIREIVGIDLEKYNA